MTARRVAFWPVSYVVETLSAPLVRPAAFVTAPLPVPSDFVVSVCALLPKVILSVLMLRAGACSAADAAIPAAQAVAAAWWRWALLLAAVAGGWDFLHYGPHAFARRVATLKVNVEYPPPRQFARDAALTLLSGAGMAAAFETAFMRWPSAAPPATLATWGVGLSLWLAAMPTWRIAHFFVVHRAMHPWRTRRVGGVDWGAVLYRHVHSWHHRSHNPSAFSGVSMHPVEVALYFSAALIPAAFGVRHPFLFLVTMVDLCVGAIVGHDGFAAPAGGVSYNHYLHHAHFEVNYGESLVPLDYLFGSWAGGPPQRRGQ